MKKPRFLPTVQRSIDDRYVRITFRDGEVEEGWTSPGRAEWMLTRWPRSRYDTDETVVGYVEEVAPVADE